MLKRIEDASPRLKARLAGVFYLLTFVTGILAIVARHGLVVDGNAATTAANLLAHESLYRLSAAADLLVVVWYVAVTAFFYLLFKPVDRTVSLLAAFFSLTGCAVQSFACSFLISPFVALRGAQHQGAFPVEQLQALAYMSLELYGQAYGIAVVFFAFYCLLIGYLILNSTFLPRVLGALMVLAGLGWLTYLFQPLARSLYPYVLIPGVIGEGALAVWLVVVGLNEARWQEKASACRLGGVHRPGVPGG